MSSKNWAKSYSLKELVEMSLESRTLNLYEKLNMITASLGAIKKDSNAPAAMGGFAFLSHTMLLAHLRTELTKYNVIIIPNGAELIKSEVYRWTTTRETREGDIKVIEKQTIHSVIRFSFDVVNGDSPQERFTAHWYGEGHDNSDKGIQKAGTSAHKYFLMKLFQVGDKDDPDGADESGRDASTPRTQSMSASMDAKSSSAPPADNQPTDVPVDQVRPDSKNLDNPNPVNNPSVDEAEVKKNQLKALIWFGESIGAKGGWFPGKVNATVQLWDMKKKQNKLTPEEAEAGSAIRWTFNQIAAAHHQICGEDCQHVNAAELGVVFGGAPQEK
jgi:ERF superfamily protein